MPTENIAVIPSHSLTKALQQGNSQNTGFAQLDLLTGPPPGDGIWDLGQGGMAAPNRLILFPVCDGSLGSSFSMRLYGWRDLSLPGNDVNKVVWIPYLLVELACVASNMSGPGGIGIAGPSYRYLSDSEYLVDTITLTQGNLGVTGSINSTGPGTNLPAYALVDLA